MIDNLSYMVTELCNLSPSFAKKYFEMIDDFIEAQTDYLNHIINHIRKSKHAVKRRERLIWKPTNHASHLRSTKHPTTQKRTRKRTREKTIIETPWFATIPGVTAM